MLRGGRARKADTVDGRVRWDRSVVGGIVGEDAHDVDGSEAGERLDRVGGADRSGRRGQATGTCG